MTSPSTRPGDDWLSRDHDLTSAETAAGFVALETVQKGRIAFVSGWHRDGDIVVANYVHRNPEHAVAMARKLMLEKLPAIIDRRNAHRAARLANRSSGQRCAA